MKKTLKELQKLQLKYAEEITIEIKVAVENKCISRINCYINDGYGYYFFNFYDNHDESELSDELEKMKFKLKEYQNG